MAPGVAPDLELVLPSIECMWSAPLVAAAAF